MKKIGKRETIFLMLFLLLLFILPIAVFWTGKKTDIRPKAFAGKGNFLLSATTTTPKVGERFDVVISLQLIDAGFRVSGADFLLLYNKDKLEVANLIPQITSVVTGAAFDDAPIVSYGGDFPDEAGFKFLRITEVAKRTDANLAGGTVSLAKVTFIAKSTGTAPIKFPNDNKYLSLVGITVSGSTPTATSVPAGATATPTGSASATNTPTPIPATPTVTPTAVPTVPPTNPPPSCWRCPGNQCDHCAAGSGATCPAYSASPNWCGGHPAHNGSGGFDCSGC